MSKNRSQSRSFATQALYQWQMTGDNVPEIINHFLLENSGKSYDVGYFRDLMQGIPAALDELDTALSPLLDRAIEGVDPVERAVLRLGAYELLKHPEIPYRVVINEAVELAKTFGADQGHRYVNGVLDKLAKTARAVEMNESRRRG